MVHKTRPVVLYSHAQLHLYFRLLTASSVARTTCILIFEIMYWLRNSETTRFLFSFALIFNEQCWAYLQLIIVQPFSCGHMLQAAVAVLAVPCTSALGHIELRPRNTCSCRLPFRWSVLYMWTCTQPSPSFSIKDTEELNSSRHETSGGRELVRCSYRIVP